MHNSSINAIKVMINAIDNAKSPGVASDKNDKQR